MTYDLDGNTLIQLVKRIRKLKSQRDELLNALDKILDVITGDEHIDYKIGYVAGRAKFAIENCESESSDDA